VDGVEDGDDRLPVPLRFGEQFETFRLCDQLDAFGLPFSLQNLGLPAPLRFQDFRLFDAVGFENGRALRPFRLHLAAHRIHNVLRRIDLLYFHARHLHAPFIGGVVQNLPQFRVDHLSRRERLVQFQFADHVS